MEVFRYIIFIINLPLTLMFVSIRVSWSWSEVIVEEIFGEEDESLSGISKEDK